ncbi:MAG: hypothetical protein QW292_13400 [Candidatus Parvarchaeota archaeon]
MKNVHHKIEIKNDSHIYSNCGSLKWKILNRQYFVGERIKKQSEARGSNVSRNSVRKAFVGAA